MSAILNPSRYAHCEGHTGVCFSQDASHIITCGEDGDIRIWSGIEDDEATDKCVGEKAFAVCQRGKKLYVATDQNRVQALTFPDADLDGVVTRFTAPVTHIDSSTDGSILVSASCDMTIGVTYVDKSTTDVISGHRAPVLSVALDPKLDFLASSSCDGTVRVWLLKDQSEVVSWNCVPKSNSWQHATALCQTAWKPDTADLLAVPSQGEVTLYQRQTWEKKQTVTSNNKLFSVVSFSTCGRYLAASSTEGHILVWSLPSLDVVASLQTDEKQHICSLAWSPELLQIAFCDAGGNFGTVDITPSSQSEKTDVRPEDIPLADPVFGDSDDDENAISLEKIKNESGFLADIPDDTDIPDEDGRSSRHSERKEVSVIPAVELQPPFQPSSTPVSLQYRYMVWNNIGIVKQINTEDENVIDVEFHDTNRHHSFRINNLQGHTLAALSEEVLVLASPASEDTASKIVCVRLNPWDGNKEWNIELPGDEEALCVAAGQGVVAVVSDTRMLRLFTTCGSQREVISLPGPVVSLTAHRDSLAVVVHSGSVGRDQSMTCIQLSLATSAALSRPANPVPMSLSPNARLRWLGYSDEGSLCSVDEAGLLRKLTPSGLWIPLCNVDRQCKGRSDHQFVVGVSESFQTVSSILCKGAFYPPTTPKPAVNEIPWLVPLCEGEGDKTRLEQKLWNIQSAIPALRDTSAMDSAIRDLKITTIQLFAVACQNGMEGRAVSLCQLMCEDTIEKALKYATKHGHLRLAKQIMDLSQSEEKEEIEDQLLSQDMFAPSTKEPSSVTDNPILALKQRLASSQSGSNSGESKSQGSRSDESKVTSRGNPFKKSSLSNGESGKGLEGIIRQAAEPLIKPQPSKLTPKNIVPKKAINNENKLKKNAFPEWFSSHKASLEEEFPDLNSLELSKVALKRFREESKPKSFNRQSIKKCFKPPTNQENKILNDNTVSPPPPPPPPRPGADTETETKKRKACDSDEVEPTPEPKKTSAASKLKFFSFSKAS